MGSLAKKWRQLVNSRKFASIGKKCNLKGSQLEVDGHVELGDFCRIRNNVILRTSKEGKIILDTYSGISYNCFFEARTVIKIGRFTGIAEFCVIRDTNHSVLGTSDHWRLTPYISDPIVIGESCLIGSTCYICPGVAIGDGAVVAQHSVVTKDIGPMEIWAGNPARRVAHRVNGIPESMKARYGDLLDRFGVRKNRHGFQEELDEVAELALQGINRAAEERDQLRLLFETDGPAEKED
ncbi:MAG: acyltransferase [Candidatus Hydrogenedentes bacterium]|jgi:acetyltransferase-like isoleucine patch superfamily enzyme|nr:acyltransferase [Candidatus Hydrogenedentota bacterium]